jgi:hypothetical protein
MNLRSFPIDYEAIIKMEGDNKVEFSLEEPGWRGRPEILQAETFTLSPKAGVKLPVLSVELKSLPFEGKFGECTSKELVYISRVYGTSNTGNLFRIYGLGWRATVNGRAVSQINWVYPMGAVLLADNPLYVDELIKKYVEDFVPDGPSVAAG